MSRSRNRVSTERIQRPLELKGVIIIFKTLMVGPQSYLFTQMRISELDY